MSPAFVEVTPQPRTARKFARRRELTGSLQLVAPPSFSFDDVDPCS